MPARFTVQVTGVDRVRAGLQAGRMLEPARDMVEALAELGQRTAQRAAKPHPADRGTLGRRILVEMSPRGYAARVYPHASIAGIAATIEEGRRPGRRPPYGAIKRWAISHGIVPEGRGNSAQVQELRERIRSQGTQGVHFMRQAALVIEEARQTRVPRTETDIRSRWERAT